MTACYDIGEELWILKRPSVAEMKRQYEEMVARLNSGDPVPFRSNNIEKIMYLRRKKLQDQVPTQDKRPKAFSRFSLSIPLTLNLPDMAEEEEEEEEIDLNNNIKQIESVEEWWSDFHGHKTTTKYAINIGSLSLGDQAIMELSTKLNPLIAHMSSPPIVTSLNLSWNDLYEEGMVAFSGILEHLSGLLDVRLDGNQMGTGGLEACMKALLRAQPQEKKRSAGSWNRMTNGSSPQGSPGWGKRTSTPPPFPPPPSGLSLSLQETNLGDDSTTTLASFLKPLPNTKTLNLTALDLTNTYIFDGITALTLALQTNTTLTSLILNSNMIGDQGAFAIGELLPVNRTLVKLEIKNCDIGPTGTSHLCEGLQAHQGLKNPLEGVKFSIDVSLNPWEFSGELLLLQTSIAKPEMKITWRDGDWTPNDDEEMETLIRTFGETVVMERLMEDKGFTPLASPQQLIESPLIATYAPVHVNTVVDCLNPTSASPASALPLTATIVQLLKVHGRSGYRSWIAVLPSVLAHLNSWMDPNLMTSAKGKRQIEVYTLDLLLALSHINQHVVEDKVVSSGIMSTCLDAYLANSNHNIFHMRMVKLIEEICKNEICGTLRAHTLHLITGDFFHRLLAVINDQSKVQIRSRTGTLTAAIMLAKAVEPFLETRLALMIKKSMKPYTEEQKGSLAGPPPPRTQAKIVFNKDKDI